LKDIQQNGEATLYGGALGQALIDTIT